MVNATFSISFQQQPLAFPLSSPQQQLNILTVLALIAIFRFGQYLYARGYPPVSPLTDQALISVFPLPPWMDKFKTVTEDGRALFEAKLFRGQDYLINMTYDSIYNSQESWMQTPVLHFITFDQTITNDGHTGRYEVWKYRGECYNEWGHNNNSTFGGSQSLKETVAQTCLNEIAPSLYWWGCGKRSFFFIVTKDSKMYRGKVHRLPLPLVFENVQQYSYRNPHEDNF